MRKLGSALTGLGLLVSLAGTGWASPAPAHFAGKSPAQQASTSTRVGHGKAEKLGGKMVNINTASAKELQAVPGIGKTRAAKIVKMRPFTSVNDLVARKILTARELEKVRKNLTTE